MRWKINLDKRNFQWVDYLLAVLLGLGIFFLVCSAKVLHPTNLAFIAPYDPSMHYLGWAVFRNGPWTWPLGLNPHYGLDIASSIVYSDAIPLLAIFFKAIRHALPEPFQYFGWWYLLCSLFQAIFAYLLVGCITQDRLVRLLGATLLAFSPIFFWRIGEHAALAGHFVLLAALYLALLPNIRLHTLAWTALLVLCAGINSYLMLMVLAIWAGHLIDLFLAGKNSQSHNLIPKSRQIVLHVLLLGLSLVLALWLFGYFALAGGASTGSYGAGKMNVLALFDSSGWSKWLPEMPQKARTSNGADLILARMEGFNYLGLGNIVLLFFALMGAYWRPEALRGLLAQLSKYCGLTIAFLGLLILAISNNISIGPWNIHIPLPEKLYSLLGIVRASGRLFWPIWYVLVLSFIYLVCRSYSRKSVWTILFLAVGLQVYDTHPGWKSLHQRLSVQDRMKLVDKKIHPFWDVVPHCYQNIEVMPLRYGQGQAHWDWIGSYASEHHLKTNAVFLARVDGKSVDRSNTRNSALLASQEFPPNTLYVLDQSMLVPALVKKRPEHLLTYVNELIVLAPNWQACVAKTGYDGSTLSIPKKLETNAHQLLPFSKGGLGTPFLIDVGISDHTDLGWGYPEAWGVWGAGDRANIVIPLPRGESVSQLTVAMRALIAPDVPAQKFSLFVNGVLMMTQTFTRSEGNVIKIPITDAIAKAGFINLEFQFFNRVRPKDIGIGEDDRNLSVGLVSARFE